jgi:hypothetical protein
MTPTIRTSFVWRAATSLLAIALAVAVGALGPVAPATAQGKGAAGAGKGKAPGKSDKDIQAEAILRKQSLRVQDKHSDKLVPIIKFAVSKGLKEQAEELLATVKRITPDYDKLPELEKLVSECPAPPDAAKVEEDKKELEKRITTAKDAHGTELFKLAKQCFKLGLFSRAFDLVNDVVEADPDHREARKILGFVRHPQESKRWITTYESDLMKTGAGLTRAKAPHVLFKNKDGLPEAWIPKKDLPQWEKGLRPFGGEFIPEEEEIKKCSMNEYRAWEVESEHFLIKTNISRRAAYEFGWELLEDFYSAFVRFYLGFFDIDRGAELLFDVKARAPKKHLVLLYPSRNHYLQHVKAEHGNSKIAVESAGFYTPAEDHCSHFYATEDREDTLGTLYHEVTHQLFAETKPRSGGSEGNNWVVEGTASYMETWAKVKGKWTPGVKKDHQRLMLIKKWLGENPSWKLQDFIGIDYETFHAEGRGWNYCMAASIVYFLMHFDDERYKEDYVIFVRDYYDGKVRKDSLPEYISVEGTSDASKRLQILDKQFREFMEKL